MKTFSYLLGLSVLISLASCTKNEACSDGPSAINRKDKASFTFCGEAKELRWEVYDGETTTTYTGESISHEFNVLTEEAYAIAYAEGKNNEEKNDQTQLDITVSGSVFMEVKDQQGNGTPVVEGATVNIYKDLDCTLDPSGAGCLIESATTDASGIAEFSNLELDTDYSVLVTTDSYQSNWDFANSNTSLSFTSDLNSYSGSDQILNGIEVKRDVLYLFVSADKFALVGVIDANGSDIWNSVPSCRQDDYLVFDANLNWTLSEGDNVCMDNFSGTGSYTNTEYTDYPPSFDVVTANTSGNLQISDNKITIIDQDKLEMVVVAGLTTQTYKFERQ